MKLQDVYDQLVIAELSNLFFAKRSNDDQELRREDLPKMLRLVQSGLTDLHTRLLLREGREPVTLVDGQLEYTVSPPTENLLAIHAIKGTYMDDEFDIPLDDEFDPCSIRRTSYNTFMVPTDEDAAPWLSETGDMTVVYHANHPKLLAARANQAPGVTNIDLPHSHLNALMWFMASRAHMHVGIKQEFHAGNNYAAKYEAEVARLKGLGLNVERAPALQQFANSGMP